MSKVIMGIGFMFILVFMMVGLTGYTQFTSAAEVTSAAISHYIGGGLMLPANSSQGGAFIDEGYGGSSLVISVPDLTRFVAGEIVSGWPGSTAAIEPNGSIKWVMDQSDALRYNVTGPIMVAPITLVPNQSPPTLETHISIPVSLTELGDAWSGTIVRNVEMPIAGQNGPLDFVGYSSNLSSQSGFWFNSYQSDWATAPAEQYTGTSDYIGAISSENSLNVPNGIWLAESQFTATETGEYTIRFAADDGAVLYVNGTPVSATSLSANPSPEMDTFTYNFTAGKNYVIAAEVVNNNEASLNIVPNGSGSPNPSMLNVIITDVSGQTVDSTATTPWVVDAYPSNPPMGTTTSGSLIPGQ